MNEKSSKRGKHEDKSRRNDDDEIINCTEKNEFDRGEQVKLMKYGRGFRHPCTVFHTVSP